MQRWRSGRTRTTRNRVYRYNGNKGSNPFLCASKIGKNRKVLPIFCYFTGCCESMTPNSPQCCKVKIESRSIYEREIKEPNINSALSFLKKIICR